jgi:hypothetical protein
MPGNGRPERALHRGEAVIGSQGTLSIALAIGLLAVACSSTIDVGQNANDGGTSAGDAGTSHSDGAAPLAAGTADVTGMVGGHSFVVKDAIGALNNTDPSYHELWVSITDHANMCPALQQGAESFASTMGLRLDLTSSGPSGPLTIGSGTYAIGDTATTKAHFAAFFFNTDALCTSGVGRVNATSGTLTIGDITAGVINGTFDLTFPAGSLKGSFGAGTCDRGTPTSHIQCAP